jgi:hypothetical protein
MITATQRTCFDTWLDFPDVDLKLEVEETVMNRDRIEIYAAGGTKFRHAFLGLGRGDLLAIPIPGSWSLQQIAIHLLDSDLIASDRIKRIAAMDCPLLIGYDETKFSQLPGLNDLDHAMAIDLFDKNRQMTAIILRQLPDAAFQRWGVHNESGKVTLAEMVDKYIDHLDGHLSFVAKKRSLLGK